MIVDCHTCIWENLAQIGRHDSIRTTSGPRLRHFGTAPPAHAAKSDHFAASEPVRAAIVVGFKSRHLNADLPNQFISDYVRDHAERMIGFAGIDPVDPVRALEDLAFAQEELRLVGVGLSPAAQNFHPCHTNAKTCYEAASARGMPILFHTGLCDTPQCVLPYAQPALLDEVAREFPNLKLVIAHLGWPWVNETIVLLGKHANVFADISRLLHQPWQAYQALLTAYQYGVMDKLLFASGFPYARAKHCIEALYDINHHTSGTSLPAIPREQLRGIVERDALELLGLRLPGGGDGVSPASAINEDDGET